MNAPTTTTLIRSGRDQARVGLWHGSLRIAHLTPLLDGRTPSSAFVRTCVDELRHRGYRSVVTGALRPREEEPFLQAGFEVKERLHLLRRELDHLPPAGRAPVRKARRADFPGILDVDARAFDSFWQLDEAGLKDALLATSSHRLGITGAPEVSGYAITGRSGRQGYLQRVAVEPNEQRQGIGRALVVDGLQWLKRWRSTTAVVNTQLGNDAALALYMSLGFTRDPEGLVVLGKEVES